jgi:hypothetical protein
MFSFATASGARTRSVDVAVSARSMFLTRPFQVGPGGDAFQNRTVAFCMWDPLGLFQNRTVGRAC